ncbi:MAG: hypothetical protein PVI34_08025, partial [Desulfobacterales bacterium]
LNTNKDCGSRRLRSTWGAAHRAGWFCLSRSAEKKNAQVAPVEVKTKSVLWMPERMKSAEAAVRIRRE